MKDLWKLWKFWKRRISPVPLHEYLEMLESYETVRKQLKDIYKHDFIFQVPPIEAGWSELYPKIYYSNGTQLNYLLSYQGFYYFKRGVQAMSNDMMIPFQHQEILDTINLIKGS